MIAPSWCVALVLFFFPFGLFCHVNSILDLAIEKRESKGNDSITQNERIIANKVCSHKPLT